MGSGWENLQAFWGRCISEVAGLGEMGETHQSGQFGKKGPGNTKKIGI